MKTHYQSLCRLTLQHDYYAHHHVADGFCIRPTPACKQVLDQHHILFRPTANGFSLLAEVLAETQPPTLLRPLSSKDLKWSFYIEASNPLLLNASALPSYRVGKTLFYFDNLTDYRHQPTAESLRYMHDTSANSTWGKQLPLVSQLVYNYRFSAPITTATISIKDRFNKHISHIPITSNEAISEYRINLADIQGMVTGRYNIGDDQGGDTHSIYFDPDLNGKTVLGLIELYHNTHVPAAYRFLSATHQLTQLASYHIKLASRKTIRRYIITKKYPNNTINLNDLSVKYVNDTSIIFSPKATTDQQQIIFTASQLLPLKEQGQSMELHLPNPPNPAPIPVSPNPLAAETIKFRDLPNPTLLTPLQKPAGLSDFSSDIYIYV